MRCVDTVFVAVTYVSHECIAEQFHTLHREKKWTQSGIKQWKASAAYIPYWFMDSCTKIGMEYAKSTPNEPCNNEM